MHAEWCAALELALTGALNQKNNPCNPQNSNHALTAWSAWREQAYNEIGQPCNAKDNLAELLRHQPALSRWGLLAWVRIPQVSYFGAVAICLRIVMLA